jgi:tRNA dimethylallyltransferase
MPKVIAIVGPTSSGKSALGVFLAHKLGGEIISADSRQVYTGMRIISRATRGHMVGLVNPKTVYSAGRYKRDATKAIQKVTRKHRVPIVVGGAGFYADALLLGWQLPEVSPNKKLRTSLSKQSSQKLLTKLKKLDPRSAKRVDPFNKVRLIRALEIARDLGTIPPLSRSAPYRVLWLGLPTAQNIKRGVEERLKKGMVAEAQRLRKALPAKRFLSLGFEFSLLADYLDKKISKQTMVQALVNGERLYAKRQFRWFKRNKNIHWVANKTEALRLAKKFIDAQTQ